MEICPNTATAEKHWSGCSGGDLLNSDQQVVGRCPVCKGTGVIPKPCPSCSTGEERSGHEAARAHAAQRANMADYSRLKASYESEAREARDYGSSTGAEPRPRSAVNRKSAFDLVDDIGVYVVGCLHLLPYILIFLFCVCPFFGSLLFLIFK